MSPRALMGLFVIRIGSQMSIIWRTKFSVEKLLTVVTIFLPNLNSTIYLWVKKLHKKKKRF